MPGTSIVSLKRKEDTLNNVDQRANVFHYDDDDKCVMEFEIESAQECHKTKVCLGNEAGAKISTTSPSRTDDFSGRATVRHTYFPPYHSSIRENCRCVAH